LTGANLFFADCGAQLETVHLVVDEELISDWQRRVTRARAHLRWAEAAMRARRHASGVSLAIEAPLDQLFVATEVNEWALCASVQARAPERWVQLEASLLAYALEEAAQPAEVLAPVLEESAALARFTRLAAREARPDLMRLVAAVRARGLPYVLDEELLTLGAGAGGRDFTLGQLPSPAALTWSDLHDIPTALVTGSNGKTTSVRLLAACAREEDEHCAYCCTDGVFLDAQPLASGDYSGPVGARQVMRERRATCAVVETARGGILRRGIAICQADVALVTNVSPDHFGEYGIDDLDALADVKLSVAGVVKPGGLLVLNGDDARLLARGQLLEERYGRTPRLALFALNADNRRLAQHRERGGATCGVRAGRLTLSCDGGEQDLGEVAAMPLSIEGSASYNIANLAGAALAAIALGIAPASIARVFACFGARGSDNLGRMMRFTHRGVQVLLDYAHNPEGLRGLLEVARHVRGAHGRLALLLGHAGNRQDRDIAALAQVAAQFHPDLIVIKENEAQLRGRAPGEIPRLIRAALVAVGFPESALELRMSELEAVDCALSWAHAGDVVVMPVHGAAARAAALALLAGA
jgi:cyanophycin synthetase